MPQANAGAGSLWIAPVTGLMVAALSQSVTATRDDIAEVVVWGQKKPVENTVYNPASVLTPEDFLSINAATTEDLVKYEPSLIVRRRFIGDSNGTLGMRGANMFQTSRSMVFADGVPLHYLLETRWAGAPRWSLVSADEIAEVEVIYGPYSAEYSGNAMGGVINIETAIPTERRFHIESALFNQQFEAPGIDENYNGYKGFFSYGDKLGDLSVYFSYNHLENESQPQTFRFASADAAAGGQSVSGAVAGRDAYGNAALYFGDVGPTESITNHYKIKLGYELEQWSVLFNAAYENRDSITDSPDNYLRSASGTPVWNGSMEQDGFSFNVRSSHFAVSEQDRQSLSLGVRLQGQLSPDWWLEASLSAFDILEDQTRNSLANPLDPAYTPAGRITDYDDTGWRTAEVKIQNDQFAGNPLLSFVTGFRYEDYSLRIDNYNSDDYRGGTKTSLNNASGGETSLSAVYAQLGWQLSPRWDLALGGRYEAWESTDGFLDNQARPDDNALHPDRSENRFSPKFSAGFTPNEHWHFRYALAKAYRFPIVEELFRNVSTAQSNSIANADLEPEQGLHHNLMLERALVNGYARVNIFYDSIEEAIFAQSGTINNISVNTFIPIDKVETRGVEFIVNQSGLLAGRLDLRLNVAYTDSEIVKNEANRLYEGKVFPRTPQWRSNLLATWHISDRWDFGGGILYASDSFNDLDNRDREDNVFGSMDGYTFLNLKSGYRVTENLKLNIGIDNVTDETAYVHHPWPGRTVFLQGSLDF